MRRFRIFMYWGSRQLEEDIVEYEDGTPEEEIKDECEGVMRDHLASVECGWEEIKEDPTP